MAGHIVASGRGDAGPYTGLLQDFTPAVAAQLSGISAEAIEELAEQFVSEGPSVAVGPGVAGQHRNATAANLATLILNSVAGNVGRTVHVQSGWIGQKARPYAELQQVIQRMASGGVGVAMVHGANPAYTLPAASGFEDAFGARALQGVVRVSTRRDRCARGPDSPGISTTWNHGATRIPAPVSMRFSSP